MVTHLAIKPFPCSMCHKSFGRKAAMQSHMRTHTNEKPCQCQNCGQTFRDESNLLRHRKSVHFNIVFECTYCDSTFTRKSNLDNHIKNKHLQPILYIETEAYSPPNESNISKGSTLPAKRSKRAKQKKTINEAAIVDRPSNELNISKCSTSSAKRPKRVGSAPKPSPIDIPGLLKPKRNRHPPNRFTDENNVVGSRFNKSIQLTSEKLLLERTESHQTDSESDDEDNFESKFFNEMISIYSNSTKPTTTFDKYESQKSYPNCNVVVDGQKIVLKVDIESLIFSQ